MNVQTMVVYMNFHHPPSVMLSIGREVSTILTVKKRASLQEMKNWPEPSHKKKKTTLKGRLVSLVKGEKEAVSRLPAAGERTNHGGFLGGNEKKEVV